MGIVIRLAKGPLLPLTLIVASGMAWVVLRDGADPTSPSPTPGGVFYMSPLEETRSQTVADWASAADVVAEVRVTNERHMEPPKSETIRDGFDLVGRVVELEVINVIWRSPDATAPNPTTFTMSAWGWMQSSDGSEREVTAEDAARLEPGHQYVLALSWRQPECAPGDDPLPARWSAIGSGAALPADGGIIGIGEFEGSAIGLQDAQTVVSPGTALAQFAGHEPSAMAAALDETPPRSVNNNTDIAPACAD